jgi:DnaD/phage-associated family protein
MWQKNVSEKGGGRMSRGSSVGTGELEFLQGFMKRGFVNIPRLLFDYSADLGLDYSTVGKLFTLLACLGSGIDGAFGPYVISRKIHPHDYELMHTLVLDLEQKEILMTHDEEGDIVTFSFIPLFAKLRAIWAQYSENYAEDIAAGGSDPVLAAAERLLARPLSDREVSDIQDWVSAYHFEVDMVQAVIKEGQRQGVTRMTYLNQVARQWYEEGIRTPEEAEAYVQKYRKSAAKHKVIINYIGIKRQLSGAEQALLDRWTDEWGFSNPVIMKACDEAAGSQNPLQYVNKVLENWLERGVKTVEDAERIQVEHKRRNVAAADSKGGARQSRSGSQQRSNVFLKREKKDDSYYDHIFKKFDE